MLKKKKKVKLLNNLNINKATQNTEIFPKIKENLDIFGDFFFSNFKGCINPSLYPWLLKIEDITPVYIKDSKHEKNNYRPFSILPKPPKYQSIMFNQMFKYFEGFFLSRC